MDIYDLSRWAPVKAETFVTRLSELAFLSEGPVTLSTEPLPDGRVRTVFPALVESDDAPGPTVQPYLLTLYNPETGTTHSFARTDVNLSTPG